MDKIIEISSYIENKKLKKFKLAGLSSDNELFIAVEDQSFFYSEECSKQELALIQDIKGKFDIEKVTFVVKPSIKQTKELLDMINSLQEEKPKSNLIQIEDF